MAIEVTAVHMDSKRNITKYPNSAIAYFCTSSGHLYKSVDSMQSWSLMHTFSGGVVEVMSSNTNSNKVVVGCADNIWVSADGGITWDLSFSL